ncbi:MAG: hypothetical protein GWN58_21455, partial [Anaerolineae bacterium]|nr:hypothetical protein [Anaerolineae bacterium]
MRQGVPLFYRSKPLLHHSADQAELCRRDIHRELITSGAYYRERLEGDTAGIGAAWLRVAGPGRLDLQHEVEETLGVKPR